jgi:hypothetical protein
MTDEATVTVETVEEKKGGFLKKLLKLAVIGAIVAIGRVASDARSRPWCGWQVGLLVNVRRLRATSRLPICALSARRDLRGSGRNRPRSVESERTLHPHPAPEPRLIA